MLQTCKILHFATMVPCRASARMFDCLIFTWSSSHVHNLLSFLRSQGHDWQERRCSLQHVVAGHVLWGGTHRHIALVHYQPHLQIGRSAVSTTRNDHAGPILLHREQALSLTSVCLLLASELCLIMLLPNQMHRGHRGHTDTSSKQHTLQTEPSILVCMLPRAL